MSHEHPSWNEDKEILTWEEEQQQERPAVERLHPAPTLPIRSILINKHTAQMDRQEANAAKREGNREEGRGGERGGERKRERGRERAVVVPPVWGVMSASRGPDVKIQTFPPRRDVVTVKVCVCVDELLILLHLVRSGLKPWWSLKFPQVILKVWMWRTASLEWINN